MDIWKKILGQNWAFYSHRKLYDMVKTEATGASAVSDADETWREFTGLMARSRDNIERLLNEAGASWEGLASESMQTGVTPLAQWTDDARTAGAASNSSVQQVGEAFSYTANAMPEPVKVTSTANSDFGGIPGSFTHLFGGQTDQDRQEREAQQAKQRAVELMQGYSRNADSAASSVGTFVPPQRVTVNVPPPQMSGGSVNYTSSSIAGPSGGDRRQSGPHEAASPDSNPPDSDPGRTGGSPGPDAGALLPSPDQSDQTTTPGAAGPIAPAPSPTPPPSGPPGGGLPSGGTGTGLPIGGFDPITGFPIDPRTGLPVDPKTGRPVGSGPWSGGGGRSPGGSPGPGGGADSEHGRGGRGGGLTGSVPVEGERVIGARGGAAVRGGGGAGAMGPMGAGAGARREEDEEHYSPDYLRDYRDEFMEGIPLTAPRVIGEGDEPPADGPTDTAREGDGGDTH